MASKTCLMLGYMFMLVVLACGESWSGLGRIAQVRRVNLAECTDCFHFEANMATCLIRKAARMVPNERYIYINYNCIDLQAQS